MRRYRSERISVGKVGNLALSLLPIPIFLAAILTIIGWVLLDLINARGKICIRCGVVLFSVVLVAQVGFAGLIFIQVIRFRLPCEKGVLLCVTESVIFLFGRLAYSVLQGFDPEAFSRSADGVIVRAGMDVLTEVIVIGLYIIIGLFDSLAGTSFENSLLAIEKTIE